MQSNQFRGIFMVSKQVFLAYSSVRATWLFKCSTRCPHTKTDADSKLTTDKYTCFVSK